MYDPMNRLREPRLLTEPQVAEILAVAPRTLRTWRKDGNGPEHLRLGSQVRYTPLAVMQYIERAKVKS